MSGGYTDSRWLRNAGIPAYGVSGLFSDPGNNGVHGKNEQVAVNALFDSKEFLYRRVAAPLRAASRTAVESSRCRIDSRPKQPQTDRGGADRAVRRILLRRSAARGPRRAGPHRRPSRASALPAARGRACALLRLLCACALGAVEERPAAGRHPGSRDKAKQRAIAALIPDMPWIADAPAFLVFLANGSRLPQIARWRDKPFPNDHLDLFFNARPTAPRADDVFMRAAAAVGLGSCPISVIRDRAGGERVAGAAAASSRLPDLAGPPRPAASRPGSGSRRCTKIAMGGRAASQIDAYDRRERQALLPAARILSAGAWPPSTAIRGQGPAIRRALRADFRRVRARQGLG